MRYLFTLVTLMVAACGSPAEPIRFEEISYHDQPKIAIAVGEIRVIEEYQAPLSPPNVEHRFPTAPAVALKNWASQRLTPSSNEGVFEFIISDASVKETPLAIDGGISGFFSTQQSEQYDARIRVAMRLYSGKSSLADALGDVTITRTRTVSENATLQEREQLFHDMTLGMMAQFDIEANRRLQEHFSAFLR